jgi:endoglucanase
MVVLLDLHNYAKYNGKKISEGGFTIAQFGDVWDRIAKLVKPQQKYIWGYGLMNEPYVDGAEKVPFWQAGIDAVRKYDPKTRITVSAEALARGEKNPAQFHLKDPARALVMEKHFYFDHDASGRYAKTYEEEITRDKPRVNPMVGVERLKQFVEVCEKYNLDCLIGEFGAPAGDGVDPRWLEALENSMRYMHEHRISSTYWAAGEYWTRRGNSYVIGENGWKTGEHVGEDRPQVPILMKYIKLSQEGK